MSDSVEWFIVAYSVTAALYISFWSGSVVGCIMTCGVHEVLLFIAFSGPINILSVESWFKTVLPLCLLLYCNCSCAIVAHVLTHFLKLVPHSQAVVSEWSFLSSPQEHGVAYLGQYTRITTNHSNPF